MSETRIGILASHQGTTFQALIDACRAGSLTATLAVVITNNSQSGAAQRGQRSRSSKCLGSRARSASG